MKHMKREFSQLSNGAIEVHRVLAADLLENGIGFTLEHLCQSG